MRIRKKVGWRVELTAVALIAALAAPVFARTQLKNICRIKGQEENTLSGLGLVVGLAGTGEANDPLTMRAIARAMEVMGNPLAMNGQLGNVDDLRRLKNAALVWVTATVPATGARRGDRLDCYISAINGKSLNGGRLAFAALLGPNTQDRRVYGLCQGQIAVDNAAQPMVGVVYGGCQMEADIFTPFVHNGAVTLILNKNHANFQTADIIAEEIERKYLTSLSYGDAAAERDLRIVEAIDAANIRVRIPNAYKDDAVRFAAELLDISIYEHEPEARVFINPRAGSIVIGGDVEIGDVVVTHKNVTVTAAASTFAVLDTDLSAQPKLEELVKQLNALKVPAEDMIEIISGIERNGKLHGKLIIE
jgi:flagellar P-ring protein precursor FlgI